MKHEWRKHEKEWYLPKQTPEQKQIPSFQFFTIKGIGNPNADPFSQAVTCLYAVSYAARMSYKWEQPPQDYYAYTVYPLEGLWDIADKKTHAQKGFSKDNLAYEIMIRQPSFVTPQLAQTIIEKTKIKKPHPLLEKIHFKTIKDGNSLQILHLGSYDSEPESFQKMKAYLKENNLKQRTLIHREIYLTDARKTEPEKQKTVLRYFLD